MRLPLFMRKLHKWLGVIIGLQVLFWVAGGLVMSYLPLDEIKAKHRMESFTPNAIRVSELVPLSNLAKPEESISEFKLVHNPLHSLYQLVDGNAVSHFFNALTGASHEGYVESEIRELAEAYYKGQVEIRSVTLENSESYEYKGRLPIWRVDFADEDNTTFYIHNDTGELATGRTTRWRVFDFVWMLHIMDYQDRSNFNTWWLVLMAFAALIFTLSGIYLVFKSFRKRRS